MRGLSFLGAFVIALSGCGDAEPTIDGGASDVTDRSDAPGSDVPAADAPGADVPGLDAPGSDASAPEVCTGGLDEDFDRATDCADDECWSEPACRDADVARVVPGLVPCGDPIELDAAACAEACAAIGTPDPPEYVTNCAAATLEATAHLYCDGDGRSAALWIEERAVTPRSQRMLTPRRFEVDSYERTYVLDWESRFGGGSGMSGGTTAPLHDYSDYGSGSTTSFRSITVRAVAPGDTLRRLLGLSHIITVLDLDSAMSTDTRTTLRSGGLTLTIP